MSGKFVWGKCGIKYSQTCRLGEHPGLVREEEFRSGTISDAIIEIGDSDNETNKGDTSDDGFSSDESSKKTTRPKKKPKVTASRSKNEKTVSQKGVPAPRHKRQVSQNVGNEAANFFASNAEYLKATTNGDSERLKLLKRREVREDKQHGLMMEKGKAEVKLAEIETKVRNAREVLLIDGMPDEVKAAARQVLIDYFTSAH